MKTRIMTLALGVLAALAAAGCSTTYTLPAASPAAAAPATTAPAPATTTAPAAAMTTPAAAPPAPAPAQPAKTSPSAVVDQFYQDITNGDYSAAWALGGSNLAGGESYASWEAGYSGTTAGIDISSYGSFSGDTVWADLAATQDDGSVKTYYGTYTVTNGVITSADIRETS
jgi:pyruvate/2-oxoglutarate dehydrogenase complex dihydrolipoamide acyltransferase (E2) component